MKSPRAALTFALLVLLASAVAVLAAGDSGGFVLTDPHGDDHGDGTLIYPLRKDMEPGDLDLLKLAVTPADGGTWFEATFARRIRRPERIPVDPVGTTLDRIAKLGFYTFNIDIYIDTDRVPGSGFTEMLPGRRATVDPATAWEKVICLTPMPYAARDGLRSEFARGAKQDIKKTRERGLDEKDLKLAREYASQELDTRYFFPTRVDVLADHVRFFVPGTFLNGTARPDWAYVVAVSGADLGQKLDFGPLLGKAAAAGGLMIMPVEPGRGKDWWGDGREDDSLEPPLVDIVVPAGQSQEAVLKDYDLRTDRPVKLTGVVPKP